jgi:hypothetical protein
LAYVENESLRGRFCMANVTEDACDPGENPRSAIECLLEYLLGDDGSDILLFVLGICKPFSA